MRTELSSIGKQLRSGKAGHPTIRAPVDDVDEASLPHTEEYWHRQESTGILAFNLGQQFLDVIQIAPGSQAHCMGFRSVPPTIRGPFYMV